MRPFIPVKVYEDEALNYEKCLSSAWSLVNPLSAAIKEAFSASGIKSSFALQGVYDSIDYSIASPSRHDDIVCHPTGGFFDKFPDTEVEINVGFYEEDGQEGAVEGFFWCVSDLNEDPGLIEITVTLPGSRRNLRQHYSRIIDEVANTLCREMLNVEKSLIPEVA